MDWQYENCVNEFREFALSATLYKGEPLNHDNVYFLDSGLCSLSYISENGTESVFLYFKPGVMLGFLRTLSFDMPFNPFTTQRAKSLEHRIYARTECRVHFMSQSKFLLLLEERPLFMKLILQSCTENYVNMISLSTNLSSRPAMERVCQTICDFKTKEGNNIILPKLFTYAELSQYLSLHTMTITKIIKKLISEDVLQKNGRQIIVLNEEKLDDIALGIIELNY